MATSIPLDMLLSKFANYSESRNPYWCSIVSSIPNVGTPGCINLDIFSYKASSPAYTVTLEALLSLHSS